MPNSYQVDQAVAKIEREVDWAQTDHIDWGFRSVHLYGIDYRYTTAGGWFYNLSQAPSFTAADVGTPFVQGDHMVGMLTQLKQDLR